VDAVAAEPAYEHGPMVFLGLVGHAPSEAHARRRRLAVILPESRTAYVTAIDVEARIRAELRKAVAVPPVARAFIPNWPCRKGRRLLKIGANSVDSRKLTEDLQRDRWIKKLVEIIQTAKLPLAAQAEACDNATLLWNASARGRKVSTLRQRVNAYLHARRFWWDVHSVDYPQTLSQIIDYLSARAEEPCPRSVPTSFLSALAFVESAGAVPPRFVGPKWGRYGMW
jgi:hypothetical protein